MALQQLDAVLDAAVDAVVVIDRSGRILLTNAAASRLFGWSRAELQGRDVGMLMPEPDRSAHDGYVSRYLESGLPRVIGTGRDVLAQRHDGSCFPARLSVGQVAGVQPPQFVAFIQDVSERARKAEDARLLQQRLMQVTRLATMGEMAAGIAHEMNQPLTAIANYALAAHRFLGFTEPELAEARAALREIAAEAQRAGEVIRRMRRVVRRGEESREQTHLPELIDELRTLCLADARACDTRMSFDIQPGLPALLVHRMQIVQVLLNLVRNALDALASEPAGRREVTVRGRRAVSGDCEIAVCDNGPGVAPQMLERMFEPFRSTKSNGAGLGLPMSQTIAQAHGGMLRHESVVPRGACFVLSLPAAAVAA